MLLCWLAAAIVTVAWLNTLSNLGRLMAAYARCLDYLAQFWLWMPTSDETRRRAAIAPGLNGWRSALEW